MKPASLHTRVTKATEDLAILLGRLELEIPQKHKEGFTAGGSPSKGGHKPLIAGNNPVFLLVMTIHAGLREMEADLQYVTAHVTRERGGAHSVTLVILDRLPSLAAGADQHIASRTAKQLEAWCGQARLALGETERWQRLPRLPGEQEPRCPWCENHTLRYKAFTGLVRCVSPACVDADGNRPEGRLGIGAVSGEPQLEWADRSSGVKAS